VVYGVPAIAVPVTARRVCVTLHPRRDERSGRPGAPIEIDAPAGPAGSASDVLRAMVQDARAEGAPRWREQPVRVEVRADLPIGAGLGSSAALAVALVRAFAPGPLEPAEVAERANRLERHAHGTPSGIDAATAAYERPVCFTKGAPLRFLSLRWPLRLAVAVLERRGDTASLVAGVRALRERGDPRFDAFLQTQREVTAQALALLEGDGSPGSTNEAEAARAAAALGALLDRAHKSLASVGVSRPAQDALCEALRRAGALGAKLSGAGGGGATIALLAPTASPAREAAILAAARAAGAHAAFITEIDAPSG